MKSLRLFALVAAAAAATVTSAQPPEPASPPVVNGAVWTDTPNTKVHVFLVFDDNDAQQRPDLEADEKALGARLHDGLKLIATQSGRTEDELVAWRPAYKGDDVTAAKILGDIDTAPIGPTDTVFFYYGGHGKIDKASGHLLTLHRAGTAPISRVELYAKLRAKNPALLVVCTDSCAPTPLKNTQAARVVRQPQELSFPPEDGTLEELFLRHRGVVDINSSAPGQFAWSHYGSDKDAAGGVFTQAFADGLTADRKAIDKNDDGRVGWDEFFAYVGDETQKGFLSVKTKAVQAGTADAKLAGQKNQTIWTTTLVPHLRIGLRPGIDPAAKGVRIAEVFDGRPAKAAGLAVGDVIEAVAGQPVTDDRTLRAAIDNIPRDEANPIVFRVRTGTAEPRDVPVVPAY